MLFIKLFNFKILMIFFMSMSVADVIPQRIINKTEEIGEVESVLQLLGETQIHSRHHLTLYTNVLNKNNSGLTLLPYSKDTYFSLSNKGSLLGTSYNVKYDAAELQIEVVNHNPSVIKYETKDFDGFKICYLYSISISSNIDTSINPNKIVKSITLPDTQMKLIKDQPQVLIITQEKVFK